VGVGREKAALGQKKDNGKRITTQKMGKNRRDLTGFILPSPSIKRFKSVFSNTTH